LRSPPTTIGADTRTTKQTAGPEHQQQIARLRLAW
jgi:hypothetical protein